MAVAVSYYVVIRHHRLGWCWMLLDCGVQVRMGIKSKWMEAQAEAEAARRGYRKQLDDSRQRQKNVLTANAATL